MVSVSRSSSLENTACLFRSEELARCASTWAVSVNVDPWRASASTLFNSDLDETIRLPGYDLGSQYEYVPPRLFAVFLLHSPLIPCFFLCLREPIRPRDLAERESQPHITPPCTRVDCPNLYTVLYGEFYPHHVCGALPEHLPEIRAPYRSFISARRGSAQ